ncbi:hypothetical protein ACFL3V_05035 [Nanoarchaeota archaeon]
MGDAKEDLERRILVIDSSPEEGTLFRFFEEQGIKVDMINNPSEEDMPQDADYRFILLGQFTDFNLIEQLKEDFPDANYLCLNKIPPDPLTLNLLHMISHHSYDQDELDVELQMIDEMITPEKMHDAREVEKELENTTIPDFRNLEPHVDQMLGEYAALPLDELNQLIRKWEKDKSINREIKMAALCKQALMGIRKNAMGVHDALELLDIAKKMSPENNYVPDLIWSAVRSEIIRIDIKEGQRGYERILTKATLPEIILPTLMAVEQDVRRFPLEEEIRPSRSNVSIVTVGNTKCYRREDPQKESLEREESILKYFRRLQNRLPEGSNLVNVPKVMGFVKVQEPRVKGPTKMPGNKNWAFYREYVTSGTRLLDAVRLLLKDLHELQGTTEGDPKDIGLKIKRKRDVLTKLFVHATRQCAYISAWGPTHLADSIKNPLDSYYVHRIDERVVDSFNSLFSAAGIEGISRDDRNNLVNCSMQIHEHLAGLDNAFYKDAWYANSLIKKGRGPLEMYAFDFVSVKQLPAVIDLATLACYGGYVNKVSKRRDTLELKMVEEFFNTHTKAVDRFNRMVDLFEQDPNAFVREMIGEDIKEYPDEYVRKLYNFVESIDGYTFTADPQSYDNLIRKVKKEGIDIPIEYINDLKTFVMSMTKRENSRCREISADDYEENINAFRNDYYTALFHRSLILSGTPCEFILRREPKPKKRDLLLSDMMGTLGNAKRGVIRSYDALKGEGGMPEENKDYILSLISMISGKIAAIYRDGMLQKAVPR